MKLIGQSLTVTKLWVDTTQLVFLKQLYVLSLMLSYELLQKSALTSHDKMFFKVIYQNIMNSV